MALKFCVYKNCENFINLKDRSLNKGITLFSFPKNPERRQKWIEYGQVLSDLPQSMYFFCSEHFDKKFLGVNQRRTILLGEAVPFPYVEPEIGESIQDDSSLDYYLQEMDKDNHTENNEEMQNEQELDVESIINMEDDDISRDQDECGTIKLCHQNFTTLSKSKENAKYMDQVQTARGLSINKNGSKPNDKTVQILNLTKLNAESTTNLYYLKDDINEEHFSIDLEGLETDDSASGPNKDIDYVHKPYKRNFEGSLIENLLSKAPLTVKSIEKIQNSNEEEITTEYKKIEEDIDYENLLDVNHVTKFIFNGEEYVKMPKDFYIREKIEMARKLQKMVCSVKAIKEYLNNLDV